jgi:tetratricopeptide (TPR) repeat protein
LGTALFRIGRIHVLLAQWPSALEAYENVAYRYLDQPECLAGYVEMATVYQRLGREADAKSTLRQALWVLERIDEEAFVRSDRQRDEIRRQIQDLLGSP